MSLSDYPLVSDWLRVADGRLVVRTGKVDIGQRISSALVQIAHEELTVPFDRIAVAPVTTADSPDEGITSGSNSIEQSGHAVCKAAATLRGRVIALAVERMGGAPGDWSLSEGLLTGPGTNRPLPMLDLAREIDLAVPVDLAAEVMATAASPAPMLGMGELVRGQYRFVHDMDLPDMLHARIVRPPHARARLREVPETAVQRLHDDGLHLLRDGSFLAVAGTEEWAVIQSARRLFDACTWDTGAGLPEGDVFAQLTPDNATRLLIRDATPHAVEIPPPLANPTHAARYERPFTMHGALAPSAACACWDGARLEVFTHSQGIYPLRQAIADSLDMDPEQVVLTHVPGSGCYGHNGADDAAFEAALVALAFPNRPVLLKWTREDEHAWEPYGPASAVDLAAVTDADGQIQSFSAEAIGGTFRGRPRPGANRAGPAKLIANWYRDPPLSPAPVKPNMNQHGGLHRNLTPIYAIPETRLVKNLVADMPHRTSALRCLGAAANVFAIESFVDDLAREHGRDPIDYRLAHLTDAGAIAVLERLREALAQRPAAQDEGRGLAYAQYKNTMTRVGMAVDVEVDDLARVVLKRVLMVADAGRVVDLDGLTAQLEGGFLQGASWALHEAVTWDRDGITSRDWDSYPVLRFDNVPRIEVIVLDRQGAPSVGAGEAASGPALAAIANAVRAATGLRLRRLPFTPDSIRAAALNG
ncbi:molybdopterin cofactor-binding domain-containing protein [Maliponia aquimaris]|uniref:Nicotinate dehydrogenase subunit B n=1 Tax=Maliponia aquimaris TaxID=1673631 RepID=A0A238KEZ5_9RHOB|nr:molybdopterin cofactor-binding domain-containing protein [Maliponia aquimaris]SMX41074.1 Nicotinate dehydrogenase subunit B [Maliponia aquimaris]